MADPTTLSSTAAHIATEKLSEPVIQAHLPSTGVLMSLVHIDTSMDGARSMVRKASKNSDLGASSAGTEATDPSPSPTVELAHATAVSATITTGVLEIALISEETVKKELGLTDSQVRPYFSANGAAFSIEQMESLLAEYVQRMIPMGLQKMAADGYATYNSIAGSVGEVTSYASIENLIEAIFTNRRQQPLRPVRERRFTLGNNQLERLTKEALTSQGGIGGSLWNTQANFSALNMPPDTFEGNGFIGAFLNYPIHEVDEELVPVNGGGDIGMFGNFGVQGVPHDAPALGGRPGGLELSIETPLQMRAEVDTSRRAIELTMLAHYIWIEIADANLTRVLGLS